MKLNQKKSHAPKEEKALVCAVVVVWGKYNERNEKKGLALNGTSTLHYRNRVHLCIGILNQKQNKTYFI